MARILLTGGTGMVGSVLASKLKRLGHSLVFLTRSKNGQTPRERLLTLIPELNSNDLVIDADLDKPMAGLSKDQLNELRGSIDKIVHCAASISFDEEVADHTFLLNVEGTRSILTMAEIMNIPEVHFTSTAYVAGDSDEFFETDVHVGQNFRNPYEKSKLQAEEVVRQWQGGSYSIYRLGVVVGDSQTGYCINFSGYYGFFKGISYLRHMIEKGWERTQKQFESEGVRLENGWLTLPLLFRNSPTSTLNLVTSDWMADTLSKLISQPASGLTFHITHDSPPLVDWVIRESMAHLKIDGFMFEHEVGDVSFANKPMLGMLQKQMDDRIGKFLPYITHEARFDNTHVKQALGKDYHPHPPITSDLLGILLDYAVSVQYGRSRKEVPKIAQSA